MTQDQDKFRSAFIAYLDNPSNDNKIKLNEASKAIYSAAVAAVQKKKKDIDVDDINTEITNLINEAIKDIYISKKKLEALKKTIWKLPKEECMFATVLTDVTGTLEGIGEDDSQPQKSRIVSEKHYKAFATIYSIKADGDRIVKIDKEAGQAAIDLSEKLLSITSKIQQANKLEEDDTQNIAQAYTDAKNHGIEKHRGSEIKNKFHNFCRIISCIFLVPIAVYAYQGSLWAKTKTQKDVENSQDTVNEFQQSFQK